MNKKISYEQHLQNIATECGDQYYNCKCIVENLERACIESGLIKSTLLLEEYKEK